MDRFDEDWTEWRCADCDPDVDRDLGETPEHDKPFVLLLPNGERTPDLCPRCNGYLSLVEGATRLQITSTPAQRWAAKRR